MHANVKDLRTITFSVMNIDVTYAKSQHIHRTSLADLSHMVIESGKCVFAPQDLWIELSGKTLGILGMGRITLVAERASAFGMKMHTTYAS